MRRCAEKSLAALVLSSTLALLACGGEDKPAVVCPLRWPLLAGRVCAERDLEQHEASNRASVASGPLRACGPWVTEGPTLNVGAQSTVGLDAYFGVHVGFRHQKNMLGGTFTHLRSSGDADGLHLATDLPHV